MQIVIIWLECRVVGDQKGKRHTEMYKMIQAEDSLHIVAHTEVYIQNVIANEPHQVGEVGGSCAVTDVAKHGLVIHCK